MNSDRNPDSTAAAIRDRRTAKRLADAPASAGLPAGLLRELLALAGRAPFHYPAAPEHCEGIESRVPWRFHVLEAPACLALREHLLGDAETDKLPALLASAHALVLATWCAHPTDGELPEDWAFAPDSINVEHIAATAAAVQNLLLAATAHGLASYWSSGGRLRRSDIRARLGIPPAQHLLGAIFLYPGTAQDGVENRPGNLHDRRGALEEWCRFVE